MAETLEPCPFCGERPGAYRCSDVGGYRVQCASGDCAVLVRTYGRTRAQAVAQWNTRKQKEPTK